MPVDPSQQPALDRLFEDLMRNESHRETYNQLISRFIQNFSTSLGIITWTDGIPYMYDPGRVKQISAYRMTYTGSYFGKAQQDRYLKLGEVTQFGNSGIVMMKPGAITGLWGKSRSVGNWTLHVKKNDDPTTLVSIPVNGSQGLNSNLDITFEAGDFLQLFIEGTGIDHPTAGLEVAWRLP